MERLQKGELDSFTLEKRYVHKDGRIVWGRLTVAWILYFLFMAASNAYVAAYYSTEAWMDFKLWGYAFPVLFIVGQGLYVARYLKDEPRP